MIFFCLPFFCPIFSCLPFSCRKNLTGKWKTGKYGTEKYGQRIKMGYLVLIRHGQARMFEKDSDQLSPLGEEQARALARFWIRQGVNFDEVYSGTLVRQRRTAEIDGECFAHYGLEWPELQTMPDF